MIQEVTMEVIQEVMPFPLSKLQYQYIVGVAFRLCIRPGYRIDVSVLPQNQCFSYLKSGQLQVSMLKSLDTQDIIDMGCMEM